MALPLTVNNTQVANPVAAINPAIDLGSFSFGGNAVGSGAATATSASNLPSVSTILVYGLIAFVVISVLKGFES